MGRSPREVRRNRRALDTGGLGHTERQTYSLRLGPPSQAPSAPPPYPAAHQQPTAERSQRVCLAEAGRAQRHRSARRPSPDTVPVTSRRTGSYARSVGRRLAGGPKRCLAVQVFREPGMDLTDLVLDEGQVPFMIERLDLGPRDMYGQPLAVPDGTHPSCPPCRSRTGTEISASANPHGRATAAQQSSHSPGRRA